MAAAATLGSNRKYFGVAKLPHLHSKVNIEKIGM